MPCQKICKGPVAGVRLPDGDVHWFAKLRKGRHRRAIEQLLTHPEDEVPDVLADRDVAKRRGRLKPAKPGWGPPGAAL
ncbi:MAG: hypothetical protein ACSLFP_16045 [Acidimicrobiales bacterium]